MAATRRKQQDNAGTWPLGTYLREQRGKMSIREAARRADISESRWRQVEAGYQQMSGGVRVAVHPRAETIASMCKAISADVRTGLQLAEHDPDQYAWLLETTPLESDESRAWFTSLPREEREAVLAELQRLHVDTEIAKGGKGRRAAG